MSGQAATARRAPWPRLPPRVTAAALSGHAFVGLGFGALIYLICLTGTVSVLVDQLKLAEQPAPAAGPLQPGALNRAVQAVVAQRPAANNLYLVSTLSERQRLTLSTAEPGGVEKTFVAGADGAVVAARTPFTDFVTELHMTLTAPQPVGGLIVGVAGAALLSLILSGVLAHPRIFRDAFRLKLAGSPRLREAELHNRLSVWGLPFHLMVTLTGALFGLSALVVMPLAALKHHGDATAIYAPIVGPAVATDPRAAPLPDLEALAERATASRPGSRLYYIGVERPGTQGAKITVEVTAPGRLPRGEDVYFDVRGREIGRGRFMSGSAGLQAYSAAAQLHFGFFGGLPVRLAYVVLGAALTFVSASGVTIWLCRREDRGRPSPRLRRAWFAWTWGAPAALALAAVGEAVAPVALTFWGVVLAAQVAAQLIALRRGGRVAIPDS